MRTLVIDPDGGSRDALRRILTERGEQTRSVETLAEGRRLLTEFVPDMVVVALDVPAGEASALAIILLIVIMGLSMIFVRYLTRLSNRV